MYQLSHILSDQKNLIEQIKEESLLDEQQKTLIVESDDSVDHNKKALMIIKESIMNYPKSLDDKVFIHEGSLIELNADDYRPICRVHLFLFNDLLIISKIKHDKKLEFISEYETRKIAVVNIKDISGVKNGINIITNDGSRVFQTINAMARNEWIDKFEVAIKTHQTPKQLIKAKPRLEESISIENENNTPIANENVAPEWILTLSEDISSEIAQRHFEDCLTLMQKCEEFTIKNSNYSNIMEIRDKIATLKEVLGEVLLHELSSSKNRDLQSLLRTSRRILKLLTDMKKTREASNIFLKVSSVALRTSQKNNRRNNLPVSMLFFCDLAQIVSEFLRAFKSHEACISSLIVWSNDELSYFAQQLMKHFLIKGTSLENIASIVENVRKPCSKLTELGLDLSYFLEGLLHTHLEMILEESRCRLIESVGRLDDNWQPYKLSKSNVRNFLKEYNDKLGIDLSSFITGESYLSLTQSTVQFCEHFINVTNSCAIIGKNHVLKPLCEKILQDFFLTQYNIKPSSTQQNIDVSIIKFKSHKIFLITYYFLLSFS